MFVDLVGSTALSTRLDPEDMREVIGTYHRCCAEHITKSGGFVAKYMGDGVLAYFGYPQAHEDDAERAVRTGLALTEAVVKLPAAHDAALQVRVGIATGVVVVGDLIGEGAAREQGVVGDTPNLAARLQSLAEPGQVVISQGTRRLTGGLFEYCDLGRVALKGLTEPAQAWQVVGASTVESRFEAHQETNLTPLVGREEELELLLRRWRQAASGEGRVVLISGEPGIGKSRLTVALQEQLQQEPHTRMRYFCSPHHQDSALYPTISQLERAAGFERSDAPDAKLEKLTSLLDASSGRESETQIIAELLSIPTGDHYAPLNLSPQRKKEKTFEALLAQLELLARQRPVLMVYEDVHWIDPSSRELLDMTVERVARLPVLLVMTFRPEFQAPWIGQAHATNVSLNRLSRRDGAALVGSVAGSKPLPDEIMEEIVERTDGVPLFVEELTKAVLEACVDDQYRRGTVSTVPLPALAVPATLHASLMARLDRLGPIAKEIAQIGAAIGREFSYELLAAVAQNGDADLQAALGRLNEAGLVFCRGTPPQATFLFKHALVRDAAYGTLLRGQRQQLHSRVVSALEEHFREIVAAQPALLARHCGEAGLAEKAVINWLKAGQQAVARSAMQEAVSQLRKGLTLLPSVPDDEKRLQVELELQIALGQALQAARGPASVETGEALARTRQLCEELNRPAQLVPVLFGSWVRHLMRGEFDASRDDAVAMQRLAEVQNDVRLRVMGHRTRGQSEFCLGEFTSARTDLERGLALFDPADRPFYATFTPQDGRVLMLIFLCNVVGALGYLDQSRARAEEGVAEARRLGHGFTLALALNFSLYHSYITGLAARAPSEALRCSEELEAVCTQHGLSLHRASGMAWRGLFLSALGHPQQGIELIQRGIAGVRATGSRAFFPFSIIRLAHAYGMAGQPAAGLERLGETISIIETTGERWYEAETHRLRGDLLRQMGDNSAAETSFRDAMGVAGRQRARLFELRASTSLARLWRDQGKSTQARDLLAPIYGWFTEGFDTPDLTEAKALLDELAS